MNNPKIIAFHLPQFHSIPENDRWWGEGFTEWTNVRKARPLFHNHYQPRVPAQDRYYNMLDPSVQDWQAELARQYGIYGFCYYHYWFKGKQLLERPVELLLERGKPDLPFCLSWANEPWTRVWDGGERNVLMPQTYGGADDWREHIRYLAKIFRDPRYIRVDGKPVMLIYRSESIRDLPQMVEVWKAELAELKLPGIHLVSMANGFNYDPRVHVFGPYSEFEPMWTMRNLPRSIEKHEHKVKRRAKLVRRILRYRLHADQSYDYRLLWKAMNARHLPPHHYPGGFADWDNSPRRGLDRSMVMRNFTRESFAKGMGAQIAKARGAGAEFLFFNAWNEWAEGTYLEPDVGRGLFFLETIRAALNAGTS